MFGQCVLAVAAGCNETEGPVERGHDKQRRVTGEQEAGGCREVTIRTGELKTDYSRVPLRIKALLQGFMRESGGEREGTAEQILSLIC